VICTRASYYVQGAQQGLVATHVRCTSHAALPSEQLHECVFCVLKVYFTHLQTGVTVV
jgi:hypothetical protein